jgi:hypothetical protein
MSVLGGPSYYVTIAVTPQANVGNATLRSEERMERNERAAKAKSQNELE